MSDHEKIELANFFHDAWTSDHEKIEVAEFFNNASTNHYSSHNEGVRCSKPAYEQESTQESSENFDRKRQPKTNTSQYVIVK